MFAWKNRVNALSGGCRKGPSDVCRRATAHEPWPYFSGEVALTDRWKTKNCSWRILHLTNRTGFLCLLASNCSRFLNKMEMSILLSFGECRVKRKRFHVICYLKDIRLVKFKSVWISLRPLRRVFLVRPASRSESSRFWGVKIVRFSAWSIFKILSIKSGRRWNLSCKISIGKKRITIFAARST